MFAGAILIHAVNNVGLKNVSEREYEVVRSVATCKLAYAPWMLTYAVRLLNRLPKVKNNL